MEETQVVFCCTIPPLAVKERNRQVINALMACRSALFGKQRCRDVVEVELLTVVTFLSCHL